MTEKPFCPGARLPAGKPTRETLGVETRIAGAVAGLGDLWYDAEPSSLPS